MQTGYAVATVADLRAIPANRRVNGLARTVVAKKRWYQYDATSIIADDGDTAIVPNDGDGAWLVMNPTADGGGGDGGDGGDGGALITVQNGKPITTPTAIGQLVADVRSDRSNLWIATGTSSASDWRICSASPVTVIFSPGSFTPGDPTDPSEVAIDFRGQRLVFGNQDPFGVNVNDTVYVAVQFQAAYDGEPYDDTLAWVYDAGYQ